MVSFTPKQRRAILALLSLPALRRVEAAARRDDTAGLLRPGWAAWRDGQHGTTALAWAHESTLVASLRLMLARDYRDEGPVAQFVRDFERAMPELVRADLWKMQCQLWGALSSIVLATEWMPTRVDLGLLPGVGSEEVVRVLTPDACPSWSRLRGLSLPPVPLSPVALRTLAASRLESLGAHAASCVGLISHLPRGLVHLGLAGRIEVPLTPAVLETLGSLEHLRSLMLEGFWLDGGARKAGSLSHLSRLRTLHLVQVYSLRAADLDRDWPNLHTLRLSRCIRVDDTVWRCLSRAPELRSLSLEHDPLVEVALEDARSRLTAGRLETLDISYTGAHRGSLEQLAAHAPLLRNLAVLGTVCTIKDLQSVFTGRPVQLSYRASQPLARPARPVVIGGSVRAAPAKGPARPGLASAFDPPDQDDDEGLP